MTRGKRNDAPCSVDGCASPSWGNGMCQKHYTRMRRHGSTELVNLTPVERFWLLVDKNGPVLRADLGPCWVWTGSLAKRGYGSFCPSGKSVSAHRYSFELARGEIPEGLHLDHLCRNPPCVNPDHLDPVTVRLNILRGDGEAAKNAAKTHCLRGHEFTSENTYTNGRRRVCRQCERIRRSA